MKKLFTLLLTITLAITCTLITACKKEPLVVKDGDNYVIVNAETSKTDLTLAGYIDSLDDYADMFIIEGGMITSIDGVANSYQDNSYWMIYTNDYSEEVSFAGYGTIEYNGVEYYQTILGVESLIIKNGYTYIFYYQTF